MKTIIKSATLALMVNCAALNGEAAQSFSAIETLAAYELGISLGSGSENSRPVSYNDLEDPRAGWISASYFRMLKQSQKQLRKKSASTNSPVDNLAAFGTRKISFSNVATKDDWNRARGTDLTAEIETCADGGCKGRSRFVERTLEQGKSLKFLEKLKLVNLSVNGQIHYKYDQDIYGQSDYWAMPHETIRAGYGDCEDYVLLKMAMLEQLGVPTKSMSMVVLKDVQRSLYHAVLVINTNRGKFVLDNVRNEVVEDSKLPHYLPLYSFSGDKSWLHGKSVKEKGNSNIAGMVDLGSIHPGESRATARTSLQGNALYDAEEIEPRHF